MLKTKEYVRFKNGVVERADVDEADRLNMFPENVANYSSNIIDLVQVGDYVNGKKVVSIREGGWGKQLVVLGNDRVVISNSESIKTIITKEQIEQIEYKVETD